LYNRTVIYRLPQSLSSAHASRTVRTGNERERQRWGRLGQSARTSRAPEKGPKWLDGTQLYIVKCLLMKSVTRDDRFPGARYGAPLAAAHLETR
jgi:hypothetical protein